MRYYVALIHKDSTFGVSFPDFPGCVTGGETIEEAIERAADILAAHVGHAGRWRSYPGASID